VPTGLFFIAYSARGIQKSSDCIRIFRITGNPHAHREQWLLRFLFEQFTNSSCDQ